MCIKYIFLLLYFPFLLVADMPLQDQNLSYISNDPLPAWVTDTSFSLEPPSAHPSQVNEQNLLIDTQYHLEEKTCFTHRVSKALTQRGVDSLSQLRFYFDPSYEQLIIHKIQVYRDGEWSDRMQTSTSKILQREQQLESGLYNGDLCLVYFLDDIRVGDIVEDACSFKGENPIFSSHFTRIFSLQGKASTEKIHYRIFGHPS
ncbi:MAG: DUF3857 domain-containing protein, partial [Rhabdochlamydiaceae bacterium]